MNATWLSTTIEEGGVILTFDQDGELIQVWLDAENLAALAASLPVAKSAAPVAKQAAAELAAQVRANDQPRSLSHPLGG